MCHLVEGKKTKTLRRYLAKSDDLATNYNLDIKNRFAEIVKKNKRGTGENTWQ